MKNYPYCGDRQLEPEDNSLAELAEEKAREDAWKELLTKGDPSGIIEDYASEDQGEVLELLDAYRSGRDMMMLDAARRMAVKLETIAEGYLYE